jgi:hypothetical protein
MTLFSLCLPFFDNPVRFSFRLASVVMLARNHTFPCFFHSSFSSLFLCSHTFSLETLCLPFTIIYIIFFFAPSFISLYVFLLPALAYFYQHRVFFPFRSPGIVKEFLRMVDPAVKCVVSCMACVSCFFFKSIITCYLDFFLFFSFLVFEIKLTAQMAHRLCFHLTAALSYNFFSFNSHNIKRKRN